MRQEEDVDEVLKMSDIVGRGFIVPINLPKTISAWCVTPPLCYACYSLDLTSEVKCGRQDLFQNFAYGLPRTAGRNDLVQRKRQISDPSTQGNTSRGWRCSVS